MRNTEAFKTAVANTLVELAKRGVTARPGTVADVIEKNITAMSSQLRIQVHSAWRYFDAATLAESLADQYEEGDGKEVGQAPMPPARRKERLPPPTA